MSQYPYTIYCFQCGGEHEIASEQEEHSGPQCEGCKVPFITKSVQLQLVGLYPRGNNVADSNFVRAPNKPNPQTTRSRSFVIGERISINLDEKQKEGQQQNLNPPPLAKEAVTTAQLSSSGEVTTKGSSNPDNNTNSAPKSKNSPSGNAKNARPLEKRKTRDILSFRRRENKEELDDGKFLRVEKTGILTKQGALVQNWKVRWFMLRVHEKRLLLQYYSNQKSSTPKGVIVLDHFSTVKIDTTRKKDNCFSIDHPFRRTWYLYGPDKKAQIEWMETLQREIAQLIKRDSFALGNSLDLQRSIRRATELFASTTMGESIIMTPPSAAAPVPEMTVAAPKEHTITRTLSSALNHEIHSSTLSKPASREKQYYNLCSKMKVELEIKDRVWRFQEYKNCFVASECVDWILRNLVTIQSRPAAVSLGQSLLADGWIQHVALKPQFEDGEFFYQFVEPKFLKQNSEDQSVKLKYISQFIQANSWVKPQKFQPKGSILLLDVNPVVASELCKLLIDEKWMPLLAFREEHPSLMESDIQVFREIGASVSYYSFQPQHQAQFAQLFKGVEKVLVFSEVGLPLNSLAAETETIIKYAQQEGLTQIIKTFYLGFGEAQANSVQAFKQSPIPCSVVKHSSFMQNFLVDGIKATKTFSLPVPESTKISWMDLRDLSKLLSLVIRKEANSKNYTLTGPEALSPAEVAQKVSSVACKTVSFIQTDLNDVVVWLREQGRPEAVIEAHSKLVEAHIQGETSVVSADYHFLITCEATPFTQFCIDYIDVLREDYLKYFTFGSQQLAVLYNQFNRMKESKFENLNEEVVPRKNFEQIMGRILQDERMAFLLFNAFDKGHREYLRFSDYAEGVGIVLKGNVREKLSLASNMIPASQISETEFIEIIEILHRFVFTRSLSEENKKGVTEAFQRYADGALLSTAQLPIFEHESGVKRLIINPNSAALLEPTNKGISFGHESWDLAERMLLGIQISLENFTVTNSLDQAQEQAEFPILQDKASSSITTFAPQIFASIRQEIFGLGYEEFISSFRIDKLLGALEEVVSTGKSGSFLYRTTDRKYLLKTLPEDEAIFFLKIVQPYYHYIKQNKDSLLTKYFGLYKLVTQKDPPVYFIVMKNIFHTQLQILEVYDLKGSTVNRMEKEEDHPDPTRALKDLNFKRKLRLGPELKESLLNQLKKDVKFLEGWSIIDYSFLVGIHNHERAFSTRPLVDKAEKSQWHKYQGGVLSRHGTKEVYFIGLVDILTEFNLLKKGEYVTKTLFLTTGRAEAEVSAVPPKQYSDRFIKYIDSIVV